MELLLVRKSDVENKSEGLKCKKFSGEENRKIVTHGKKGEKIRLATGDCRNSTCGRGSSSSTSLQRKRRYGMGTNAKVLQ